VYLELATHERAMCKEKRHRFYNSSLIKYTADGHEMKIGEIRTRIFSLTVADTAVRDPRWHN